MRGQAPGVVGGRGWKRIRTEKFMRAMIGTARKRRGAQRAGQDEERTQTSATCGPCDSPLWAADAVLQAPHTPSTHPPHPQDMRAANAAMAGKGSSASLAGAAPALSVVVRAFPLPMCALDRSAFVLPAMGAAAVQARCAGGWGLTCLAYNPCLWEQLVTNALCHRQPTGGGAHSGGKSCACLPRLKNHTATPPHTQSTHCSLPSLALPCRVGGMAAGFGCPTQPSGGSEDGMGGAEGAPAGGNGGLSLLAHDLVSRALQWVLGAGGS